MASENAEVKYFRVIGDNSVLQHDQNGWTRWDASLGLVKATVDWHEDHPQLEKISFQDAVDLMR